MPLTLGVRCGWAHISPALPECEQASSGTQPALCAGTPLSQACCLACEARSAVSKMM